MFDQLLKIYEDKIELRIYGNKKKTEKSRLKKFSSVEFFDAFNPNQIDKILSWADIGVAPTYFETYSRIVREYINFGIVPISTNAFGVSELITSNKNGILIDRPFSKNLFDIVEKIILDTNFLKKLQDGIKNSKIVSKEDEFTKIFQLYNDLIKS